MGAQLRHKLRDSVPAVLARRGDWQVSPLHPDVQQCVLGPVRFVSVVGVCGAFGMPVNPAKCGLCRCGKSASVRVCLYLTWCQFGPKCCECDKCAFC